MSGLSRGTKADQFSYVPAGTVLPFAGDTAPSGWAICNGDPVSRTDYAELFTAIGELWGVGDGSTTFNLPDMRGQFLRGKDYGRHLIDGEGNPDGDLDVGTQTSDGIRNITGRVINYTNNLSRSEPSQSGAFYSSGNNVSYALGSATGPTNYPDEISMDASLQVPTAADNRPKNVTVNYIIKL